MWNFTSGFYYNTYHRFRDWKNDCSGVSFINDHLILECQVSLGWLGDEYIYVPSDEFYSIPASPAYGWYCHAKGAGLNILLFNKPLKTGCTPGQNELYNTGENIQIPKSNESCVHSLEYSPSCVPDGTYEFESIGEVDPSHFDPFTGFGAGYGIHVEKYDLPVGPYLIVRVFSYHISNYTEWMLFFVPITGSISMKIQTPADI